MDSSISPYTAIAGTRTPPQLKAPSTLSAALLLMFMMVSLDPAAGGAGGGSQEPIVPYPPPYLPQQPARITDDCWTQGQQPFVPADELRVLVEHSSEAESESDGVGATATTAPTTPTTTAVKVSGGELSLRSQRLLDRNRDRNHDPQHSASRRQAKAVGTTHIARGTLLVAVNNIGEDSCSSSSVEEGGPDGTATTTSPRTRSDTALGVGSSKSVGVTIGADGGGQRQTLWSSIGKPRRQQQADAAALHRSSNNNGVVGSGIAENTESAENAERGFFPPGGGGMSAGHPPPVVGAIPPACAVDGADADAAATAGKTSAGAVYETGSSAIAAGITPDAVNSVTTTADGEGREPSQTPIAVGRSSPDLLHPQHLEASAGQHTTTPLVQQSQPAAAVPLVSLQEGGAAEAGNRK